MNNRTQGLGWLGPILHRQAWGELVVCARLQTYKDSPVSPWYFLAV